MKKFFEHGPRGESPPAATRTRDRTKSPGVTKAPRSLTPGDLIRAPVPPTFRLLHFRTGGTLLDVGTVRRHGRKHSSDPLRPEPTGPEGRARDPRSKLRRPKESARPAPIRRPFYCITRGSVRTSAGRQRPPPTGQLGSEGPVTCLNAHRV